MPVDRNTPQRESMVHCDACGEDFSSSYKTCPFCDEPSGKRGGGGRRAPVASNSRGGGYGRGVSTTQIGILVASIVLIIAACFIVFKMVSPLFNGGNPSGSSSISTPDISNPDVSMPDVPDVPDISEPDVPVVPDVLAVSLNKDDITVKVNELVRLTATILPASVDTPIIWTSSDESLCTVSADGIVRNINASGVKKTITITATAGDKSATCLIRCSTDVATGTIEPPPITVDPGTGEKIGIVSADGGLRVRSGPGTAYDHVITLATGSSVIIEDDSDAEWYKVSFKNGSGDSVVGYMFKEYVTVS